MINYFYRTEAVVTTDVLDGYPMGTPAYFLDFEDKKNVVIVIRDGRMFERLDQENFDSIRDYINYQENRCFGTIKDWLSGMKILVVPNNAIASLRLIEEGVLPESFLKYF